MTRRMCRRWRRCSVVEPMEGRVLLSASPLVIESATLGTPLGSSNQNSLVTLTTSETLAAATVNSSSVLVFTAGKDQILGTGDDVLDKSATVTYIAGTDTITINTKLASDTPFALDILGNLVTDNSGNELDGAFNGFDTPSGDGTPGSDYQFQTAPEAIFNTIAGTIDVPLFPNAAPLTVANFEYYANNDYWMNTFINRATNPSTDGLGVLQGGAYNVNTSNSLIEGQLRMVGRVVYDVPNEFSRSFGEFGLGNSIGTISMAKTSNPNSATNQWFFNYSDNSSALDSTSNSGGFTVFGEISPSDSASLAVLNALAAYQTEDLSSVYGGSFGETPLTPQGVTDTAANEDQITNPDADVLLVNNISIQMNIQSISENLAATITSKPPSLIYTGVPTSVYPGVVNTGSVTVSLQNEAETLSGTYTVTLYANSTPNLDGSPTQIYAASQGQSFTFTPGQKTTITIPLSALNAADTTTVTAGVTGTTLVPQYLVAQIAVTGSTLTSPDVIAASTTQINFAAPGVDLTDKIIKVPSLAFSGKTATVSVQVTNSGNITADGPLGILLGGSISASGSDESDFGTVIENLKLAAGASQTFNVTVTIPSDQASDNYFLISTLEDTDESFGGSIASGNQFVNTPFTTAIVL